MANKKKIASKKNVKKAKKLAKKKPKTFFTLLGLVIVAVVIVFVLWKMGYISFEEPKNNTNQLASEKTYSFSMDTKYYSVEYDEGNNEFIIKNQEELSLGGNYVLAKDIETGVSLYILEGTSTKEKEYSEMPSSVTSEYIWTYKETKDNSLVFTKYSGGIIEDVIYDDFQIHFMMLGNDAAGDCAYIKAGNSDILIDAGSKSNSYETTSAYINQYCQDKSFEFVIATHGDADHISAFPKFFKNYEIDTVIDFACETSEQFKAFKESGKSSRDYFSGTTKTTDTYGSYLAARDTYAKHHYTAGDCYMNLNGAKRSYKLSENVTMDILYNYYYFDNDNNGKVDSTDENNFSVLTLFTYNQNGNYKRFFLGGDLELEGEEKFAQYYDGSTEEKTMPTVDLYKAGHHGSKTSSNDCLLNVLQPKLCVCCCCCGTDEYTGNTDNQFPTQAFIDRIAKWTDKVYAPSVIESYTVEKAKANSKGTSDKTGVAVGNEYIHSSGFIPMNGNIIVSSNGINVGLWASNNLIKLKDSDWFNSTVVLDGVERKMRTWPSN